MPQIQDIFIHLPEQIRSPQPIAHTKNAKQKAAASTSRSWGATSCCKRGGWCAVFIGAYRYSHGWGSKEKAKEEVQEVVWNTGRFVPHVALHYCAVLVKMLNHVGPTTAMPFANLLVPLVPQRQSDPGHIRHNDYVSKRDAIPHYPLVSAIPTVH